LITREAIDLYFQKLDTDGVLAFHISNRYLNLAPLVSKLSRDSGPTTAARRRPRGMWRPAGPSWHVRRPPLSHCHATAGGRRCHRTLAPSHGPTISQIRSARCDGSGISEAAENDEFVSATARFVGALRYAR
jgi:hypothetical protein